MRDFALFSALSLSLATIGLLIKYKIEQMKINGHVNDALKSIAGILASDNQLGPEASKTILNQIAIMKGRINSQDAAISQLARELTRRTFRVIDGDK